MVFKDMFGFVAFLSFLAAAHAGCQFVTPCPNDIVVNSNTETCDSVVTFAAPTFTPGCGPTPTPTVVPPGNPTQSGVAYPVGLTTITWVAGTSATVSRTCVLKIRVRDVVSPTIDCGAVNNIFVDSSCATPNFIAPIATATDNCGIASLTSEPSPTPSFPLGTTRLRNVASDAANNRASCDVIVNTRDNIDPTFSNCPQNQDLSTDAGVCTAAFPFGPLAASDNCAANPVIVQTRPDPAIVSPGPFPLGTTVNRFVARDGNGNNAVCLFSVSVTDREAPTLSSPPGPITVSCAELVPVAASVSFTDNCAPTSGQAASSDTEMPGSCANRKLVERTWTATDAAENSASVSQTITVDDRTRPNFVEPAPPLLQTYACAAQEAAVPAAILTATDNCMSGASVAFSQTRVSGSCPNRYALGRRWRASDTCGNFRDRTQGVIVADIRRPVFASSAPSYSPVQCRSEIPAAEQRHANDNCDGDLTATVLDVETAGTCPNQFSVERTWTVSDACSNTATSSSTITVSDTTSPVLSGVETDKTIECSGPLATPPTFPVVTAADNCDSSTSVSSSDVIVTTSCSVATTRTWTATDSCSNVQTASQTITVVDTTAPVLTGCPGSQSSVVTDEGQCYHILTNPGISATDGCDTSSIEVTFSPSIGSRLNVGNHVIVASAVDASGNQQSCSFTLAVSAGAPPPSKKSLLRRKLK